MPMVWTVIDGALRTVAVAASAIIALSFVLFAVEEVSEASRQQQSAIAPSSADEQRRAAAHTPAREAVDDANDVVLAPFAAFGDASGNAWARRGVPALLGLLVYGVGLAYLARLLGVRAR